MVWALSPAQVRELLKRRCFDQALDLVDLVLETETTTAATSSSSSSHHQHPSHTLATAAGTGSSNGMSLWPEMALAQAGQLLLLGGEIERGLAVLERCPPDVFQPCQLFHLFPEEMERLVWGLEGALCGNFEFFFMGSFPDFCLRSWKLPSTGILLRTKQRSLS